VTDPPLKCVPASRQARMSTERPIPAGRPLGTRTGRWGGSSRSPIPLSREAVA
jgi:hypothetical protein